MKAKPSAAELEQLLNRSTTLFAEGVLKLVRSVAKAGERAGALDYMAKLIGQSMTLADLLGRRRLLLEFDAYRRSHKHTRGEALALAHRVAQYGDVIVVHDEPGEEHLIFVETPVVPHIPFDEAIRNIITREPRLAQSGKEVADLYATRHAFALAKSTELTVTTWVQNYIDQSLKRGASVPEASEIIAEAGDFSRAYAETVYRTNVATAYAAGRFEQANDDDVKEVIGAFELETAGDLDVRKNHAAAGGLTAPCNHHIWNTFACPMGYNCRCSLRFVTWDELRRRGLVDDKGNAVVYYPPGFSAAHPDPGFGNGRPDIRVYTGSLT